MFSINLNRNEFMRREEKKQDSGKEEMDVIKGDKMLS